MRPETSKGLDGGTSPVVVVGAGLAGLACARTLRSNDVSAGSAPPRTSLVSFSLDSLSALPDDVLDRRVREEPAGWLGQEDGTWRLLRVDRIDRTLPRSFDRSVVEVWQGVPVRRSLRESLDRRGARQRPARRGAGPRHPPDQVTATDRFPPESEGRGPR